MFELYIVIKQIIIKYIIFFYFLINEQSNITEKINEDNKKKNLGSTTVPAFSSCPANSGSWVLGNSGHFTTTVNFIDLISSPEKQKISNQNSLYCSCNSATGGTA
jgi:hypothetical protein